MTLSTYFVIGSVESPSATACELDGCDDRHYAQGMCQSHYLRDYRARKAAA